MRELPTTYRIRKVAPADANRIADIYLEAVRGAMPWLHLAHTDEQCRAWIVDHVVPDLDTWVADDDEVGAMLVLAEPRRADEPACIGHLYVHSHHQRRGVGSTLVDFAKSRYPDGLQLWAFQRNEKARRFYERRGFLAVEFTDGSSNDEREPDVRYVWSAGC